MKAVNPAQKLGKFLEYWSPKIVASQIGNDVMVVKAQSEFVWHSHDDTDDLFLVQKGQIDIQLRDRTVTLNTGNTDTAAHKENI